MHSCIIGENSDSKRQKQPEQSPWCQFYQVFKHSVLYELLELAFCVCVFITKKWRQLTLWVNERVRIRWWIHSWLLGIFEEHCLTPSNSDRQILQYFLLSKENLQKSWASNVGEDDYRCQFHQCSTSSFCTSRFQKRKKILTTWLNSYTFGSYGRKSCT